MQKDLGSIPSPPCTCQTYSPALRRWRQKSQKFKVFFDNIASFSLAGILEILPQNKQQMTKTSLQVGTGTPGQEPGVPMLSP